MLPQVQMFCMQLFITIEQMAPLEHSTCHVYLQESSSSTSTDMRWCRDCASFRTVSFFPFFSLYYPHVGFTLVAMKCCWLYLKSKLDSQVLLLHAFTAHFWFILGATAVSSAASLADTLTSESHQVSDLKGSFLIYSAAHRIPLQPRQSTLTVALNTLAAFGSSIEIESCWRAVQLKHNALFRGFIMKWRCKQIVFFPSFSLNIPSLVVLSSPFALGDTMEGRDRTNFHSLVTLSRTIKKLLLHHCFFFSALWCWTPQATIRADIGRM